MDSDDNSKDCTSDSAEDKIILVGENDTEHMDTVDVKHTVDIKHTAEPICETSEVLK